MLRVLTLSSLFPDAGRPTFGVFVERQTLGLAAHPEVDLRVVAPVGVASFPFSRHPRYRGLAALPRQETWKGLTVYRPRFPVVPVIGGRLSPALMARTLLPLLRRIRAEFPFDVIDAEFFYPDGPAAARLGKALGVPVSIKARGSDIHHWSSRPGCRRQIVAAGAAAAGLLAVSAALRGDMIALGMAADKIRVHYTGVDLDAFRPRERSAAKAALGLTGPLLLSVGYLIDRKGQQIAVAAMPAIPDATLLIVGQGPARAALEAQVAALGLRDRVRLLGPLPHEALPALFAAADVMVLPSVAEGLANAWVEALASGTPVVTADVGGAREVIDRPAAGRLAARDAASVAAAIHGLLANPPAQAEVRAVAERFTWEANRAALYDHLSGLIPA
ncbi:MAG: glycoside hydrolase [Sphingomonas bacterium]|nr:glycosyltransferase [Sphingomonas bacterium]MDB5689169.1 glycoside hydrolase [Sphingomonas bacterium]